MPKDLPEVPSLEHLKKQAKTLLDDFRVGQDEAVTRLRAVSREAAPKLADAQRALAREHGFASWARLKKHVEANAPEERDPVEAFRQAIRDGDAKAVEQLFKRHPELKLKINDPIMGFDSPPIIVAAGAKDRTIIEVLLRRGANINQRTQWWAGGFGVLDSADKERAAFLIERGATVDVHAAAHLGMIDRMKELIEADPGLVRARGGDGQTPLHFASTVKVAAYLLDHGADIDALDVDHESTPAQYMVDGRADVARYLVKRGCKADILMAAALNDMDLAEQILTRNAEAIRTRVSAKYFPMASPKAGGTIYYWTLGWYVSPCQVAKRFGHREMLEFLLDRCPPDEKLLNACWLGDEALVKSLLAAKPNLASELSGTGRASVADAARNNNTPAVRLMLMAGLPADSSSQQHQATPLHWAAFHGNVEMLGSILEHGAPVDNKDNDYKGTAIDWALHGSENGWNRAKGDYPAVIELLVAAGTPLPFQARGSAKVREVLRRHRVPGA